jgi:2-methylisocitrate lyase-like PEP mutase family enzyme
MIDSPAQKLRKILKKNKLHIMPCCYDPLSAKMIEQAKFDLSFMSGFATAAAKLGLPDTGLISYGEIIDQGRNICDSVNIPIIGDGDTGYGNAINVRRTVRGFYKAGFAAVMIEDQVSPKRCGHTRGKKVVALDEAIGRIKAAVDEKKSGSDILIMARTDARFYHGLDEAINRMKKFQELGADILFIEGPKNKNEMKEICKKLTGIKLINLVEGGDTPLLKPKELESMGFNIAAYPLTILSAAMKATKIVLENFQNNKNNKNMLMSFSEMQKIIGFDDYFKLEKKYKN